MIVLGMIVLTPAVFATPPIVEDSFHGVPDFPRELIQWNTLEQRSAGAAIVDVLFVYDNSTRQAWPNVTELEVHHDEWVAIANTILMASNVDHRFRRVGSVHINHDGGTSASQETNWLFESVTARNLVEEYKADLVTLHAESVGRTGSATVGGIELGFYHSTVGNLRGSSVLHEWMHNHDATHGDNLSVCPVGRCGLQMNIDGALKHTIMLGSYAAQGSVLEQILSSEDLPGANPMYQNVAQLARDTMPIAAMRNGDGCLPSPTNLCLSGNRFRVEVAWTDFGGNTGAGQVVPGASADSGLFWFFNQNNWEMMVKVIKACNGGGN